MFKPANSDHAVSGVIFSVNFAQEIPPEGIALLKGNHPLWRQDLPAILPGGSLNIEMTPDGPRVNSNTSVQYAYLRPDGTPAWMFSADNRHLSVHCSRYTRWHKVSEQALGYIKTAFELLARNGYEISIMDFSLSVQDDFFWSGDVDNYDLTQLFIPNELITQVSFRMGTVWHSHSAWFETGANAATLVHFNVDATRDNPPAVDMGLRAKVAILNLQSFRPVPSMQTSEVVADFESTLVTAMEAMHMRNKSLLRSVLIPSMSDKIGLK